MKLVLPLLDFTYTDRKRREFVFSDNSISLRNFSFNIKSLNFDKPKGNCGMFSEYDYDKMEHCFWSLEIENLKMRDKGYRIKVNLLLLCFKIMKRAKIHFQYHLAPNIYHYGNFREDFPMKSWLKDVYTEDVSYADLVKVNALFEPIIEMEQISIYTHNAVYFLYSSYTQHHWVDKFILLWCALENLFLGDSDKYTPIKSVTSKLSTRISNYLKGMRTFTQSEIKRLYRLRSNIVHGLHKTPSPLSSGKADSEKNLEMLEQLESIVLLCIKKILLKKDYRRYTSKTDRLAFLDSLG